jgi:hypothetical protein
MDITLKPASVQFTKHLPELTQGRASALHLRVHGVPDDLDNVELHAYVGTELAVVIGRRLIGGVWTFYANGAFFPNEGISKYHLTAKDDEGGSVWLGSGRLRVVPSVLNVDDAEAPILPKDTYVRNPVTGLYHLLTVKADEDGLLTPEIADEGVEM